MICLQLSSTGNDMSCGRKDMESDQEETGTNMASDTINQSESTHQLYVTPSTSFQTSPTSDTNGDNGIQEDHTDLSSPVPSNNANNGPDLESLVNEWFKSIGNNNDEVSNSGWRHLGVCVERLTLRKCVGGDSESGDSNLSDLLKKLIRCAYLNDLNGEEFGKNLKKLLEGRIFQSTVSRAKLYSRLIEFHCILQPEDISPGDHKPEFVNDCLWKQIVEAHGRTRLMSSDSSTKSHHGTVLTYLMRELEEDDDIMTLIFANPSHFKVYPEPYFEGCTLEMVEEMSKPWVSESLLYSYHFKHIFDPIFEKLTDVYKFWKDIIKKDLDAKEKDLDVKEKEFETTGDLDTLRKEIWTNEKFIEAKVMLWNELGTRGGKAGARLLWFFLREMRGKRLMVGHLVKEVFSRPRDRQLKRHFLDINPDYWSELVGTWGRTGTDQEENGEGQFINIGLPSSYTDYNLLCWAARRGYYHLIRIVAQIFKPSSNPDPYLHVNTVLGGTDAWKCALWCATRHGQIGVIRELLAPKWIIESIDFNDYPWGWLPPVHLVALLGDVILLRHFAKVELSAIKKLDYLGRTPLDHAMPFISAPQKIKHHFSSRPPRTSLDHNMPSASNPKQICLNFSRPSQKGTRFNKNGQQQVVKQLLEIEGVEGYLKDLYSMYINQANTVLIGAALIASVAFVGWLQPPLGYSDYFQFTQPSPPAPAGTYDSYVAVEGHLSIQIFVVFNTLSFFLAIATMFLGTEATLFVRDRHERSRYLFDMRKSVKWMVIFFIGSMLFIMAAFVSAGFAVLPPIWKLKWSMIVSLIAGAGFSVIPLIWMLKSSMSGNWNFFRTFLKQLPLHPLKNWNNDFTKNSLVEKFSDEDCNKLFDEWDADKDGSITIRELLNIKSGYWNWTQPEAREIMEKADDDGNERLDLEEFKKMHMIMPVERSELPSKSGGVLDLKEDLKEFGPGSKKGTETITARVTTPVVKDIQASLETGATVAQVNAMQRDSGSYCNEPEDENDFATWVADFNLDDRSEEIEEILSTNAFMQDLHSQIVPDRVNHDTFWTRYFYRLNKLQQINLVKRATDEEKEEDLSRDADKEKVVEEEVAPAEVAIQETAKLTEALSSTIKHPEDASPEGLGGVGVKAA